MPEFRLTVAAFDVAASDLQCRLTGLTARNSKCRRAIAVRLAAPVAAAGILRVRDKSIACDTTAQDLVFLRRQQRIAAIDVVERTADRTGSKEQTRRRDLSDRIIVGEHEARIDVELFVDFVVSEEPRRPARIGTLQVVERAVIVLLACRSCVRHEGAGARCAIALHKIVDDASGQLMRRTRCRVVDRIEAIVVARSGACKSRARGRAGVTCRTSREIALRFENGFGIPVTDIGCDIALTVRGIRAHDKGTGVGIAVHDAFRSVGEARGTDKRRDQRAFGGVVVVRLVDAVLAVELDAFEVLAHDEVHNAGFCIRAVHRGGATRQNFNVIHKGCRNIVQVRKRGGRVARHQARAVDENQGALRAEATKVDCRLTGRGVRHRRGLVRKHRGQIVQKGFDAGRTFEFHFLLADRRDRTRAVEPLLRNTRTRDDDRLRGFVLRVCRPGNANRRGRTEKKARPKSANTCEKWHEIPLFLTGRFVSSGARCPRTLRTQRDVKNLQRGQSILISWGQWDFENVLQKSRQEVRFNPVCRGNVTPFETGHVFESVRVPVEKAYLTVACVKEN